MELRSVNDSSSLFLLFSFLFGRDGSPPALRLLRILRFPPQRAFPVRNAHPDNPCASR